MKKNQLTIEIQNKSKDKSLIMTKGNIKDINKSKSNTKLSKKTIILKSSSLHNIINNSKEKISTKKQSNILSYNALPMIHSSLVNNQCFLSNSPINENMDQFSEGFSNRNLRQIMSRKDITNTNILHYYHKKRNDISNYSNYNNKSNSISSSNNNSNRNSNRNSNSIYSQSLLKAIASNKLSLLNSNSIKFLYKNNLSRYPKKSKLRISPMHSKNMTIISSSKIQHDNDDYTISPLTKNNRSIGISQTGKCFKNNNPIKINQDSYLIIDNPINITNFHIYGIMDGHGSNGHFVSQYIVHLATKYFSSESTYQFKHELNKCTTTIIEPSMSENIVYNEIKAKEYELIKAFYSMANNDLRDEKFDIHYSGSTCLMIFHIGNRLICSNTGDSRAILIRENPLSTNHNHHLYEVIPLSIDHKPNIPSERTRIESLRGVVSQCEDSNGNKYGPYRVWVKGESYPGIAISRTIGDEVAEHVGVIYDPDIRTIKITQAEKYIILASDGLWDALSNEEVMNIMNPFYAQGDIENGCKFLINEAANIWKKNHADIDDITVIIATLQGIDSILNTFDSEDIVTAI